MSFAIWIKKTKPIENGSLLYGECLSGNCLESKFNFTFRGEVHQIGEKFRHSLHLEIEEVRIDGEAFTWRTNKGIEGSRYILTDEQNLKIIFQGNVSFILSEKLRLLLPKRGELAFPVNSEQGWVGVLIFERKGIFQLRETWQLIAYSTSTNMTIGPCKLFGPNLNRNSFNEALGELIETKTSPI